VVTVVNQQIQGFGAQKAAVKRVVRRGIFAIRSCYQRALKRKPTLTGKLLLEITISKLGRPTSVEVKNDTLGNPMVSACIKGYARRWRFPPPPADGATFKLTINFRPVHNAVPREYADENESSGPPALSGKLAAIHNQIKMGNVERALVDALRWRAKQPGNVLALLALGDALEKRGSIVLAARVYGSMIDLFPSRADLRRFAGNRLEALGKVGLGLAADTYGQAVKQRPDHGSSHRMLAYALLRQGKREKALATLEAALTRKHRRHRSGVERILREDLGLVAAALVAASPKRREEIKARIAKHNVPLPEQSTLRFVLTWETDANDVDFHIRDGQGGHAYYGRMTLPSGGSLYADVRNGYGPECFAIDGKPSAFPYQLQIHYFSRGPMGYGMGTLQILQHDGRGRFKFEDRPFVVMNDRAYVNLGVVKGPL
jgi:TonB family protein